MTDGNEAFEALKKTLIKEEPSSNLYKWISLFVQSLYTLDSETSFSANTVTDWACEYSRNPDLEEQMPQGMFSNYTVGRYLARNMRALQIQENGSYGNRAIYKIRSTFKELREKNDG